MNTSTSTVDSSVRFHAVWSQVVDPIVLVWAVLNLMGSVPWVALAIFTTVWLARCAAAFASSSGPFAKDPSILQSNMDLYKHKFGWWTFVIILGLSIAKGAGLKVVLDMAKAGG